MRGIHNGRSASARVFAAWVVLRKVCNTESITKTAKLRRTGRGPNWVICQLYAPKEWANLRIVMVPLAEDPKPEPEAV
jgi:hypothetical protein